MSLSNIPGGNVTSLFPSNSLRKRFLLKSMEYIRDGWYVPSRSLLFVEVMEIAEELYFVNDGTLIKKREILPKYSAY